MSQNILGELEQKVMDVLWESETPMKPLDVKKTLKNKYAYTTIMTVLSRLYEKGYLKRNKNGKAYYYLPCIAKDKFAKNKLKKLFSNILFNYKDLAISQFVDAIEDNPKELQKLKEYLKDKNGTT